MEKKALPKSRQSKKKIDKLIIILVFIISIFGLVMVYNSSIVEASEQFADKFHYLKYQSIYFIIGWLALIFISKIDYHLYPKIIRFLFYSNILALLLVFTPLGMEIKGARRWLNLGFTSFQPSEPFKTILVIYLSTWLQKKRSLNQFLGLMVLVLGLIIFEPDLGTSIVIIFTSFILYYISGADIFKFSLACFSAGLLGILLIFTSPYRRQRFLTFINPSQDGTGTSYHIKQITLAIGSGGFTGLGIGNSKQKYQYLPEATSDSIFAILAEETGFIGSSIIVLIFLCLIWRSLSISQKAPDPYGRYLATGIISWISIQTFLNLSSMLSIVPLTGIPLPFFSYGGTSLVVSLASIGILLNISKASTEF